MLDTRVMKGADVYSDHYLVRPRIRLTLVRVEGRKNVRERFDVGKLYSEEIRRKYNVEVRNRFEALGDIDDPEEEHDMILATYRDAAKEVLGSSNKLSRQVMDCKQNVGDDQGEEGGKIGIRGCKIGTTQTEVEGGV